MSFTNSNVISNIGNINSGWSSGPWYYGQQGYSNGSLGSGSVGVSLSGNLNGAYLINEMSIMDPMGMLSLELQKGCPQQSEDKLDAIYPTELDLNLPALRFHLLVYRNSSQTIADDFWKLVKLPVSSQHLSGNVAFRSRIARRNFLNWWSRYIKILYAGIQPIDLYLPRIRPGEIKATFVEHVTALDSIPYDASQNVFNSSLTRGLMEVLPAWAWIAENCRKPVYRQHGGWFFISGAEAAKFVLFGAGKKLST